MGCRQDNGLRLVALLRLAHHVIFCCYGLQSQTVFVLVPERHSLLLLLLELCGEVGTGLRPVSGRRIPQAAADATILPYMRLVTFQRHASAEPGVLLGEDIVSIRGAGYEDTLSVIAGGADALERVRQWVQDPPPGDVVAARDATLRAPLPRPPKIL